jgi:Tfp pilus assembly protein PilF
MDKHSTLNANTLALYLRMLEKQSPEKLKALAPDLALQVLLTLYSDLEETSLDLAEKLLLTAPKEPFLMSRKAEALQGMGKIEEALAVYAEMQKVMPDFMPILMAQADLYQGLAAQTGDPAVARKQTEEALKLLRQYVASKPKDPEALQKLATLLQDLGQNDEANRLYRKVVELDPNNWSAYNNLAWNLSEQGKLDEAAQMGEKAIKLAGQAGGVLDTLGWIELKRGKLDRAVDLLRQASQRLPNHPEVRFHLAQALERKGDKAGAAAELESIILAVPDYDKIDQVKQLLEKLAPQSNVLASQKQKN